MKTLESVFQVLKGLSSSWAHFFLFWSVHSWAFPVWTQTMEVAMRPLADPKRPDLQLPQSGWASKPATHHENYALFPSPGSAPWQFFSPGHQEDPRFPTVTEKTEPRGRSGRGWVSPSRSIKAILSKMGIWRRGWKGNPYWLPTVLTPLRSSHVTFISLNSNLVITTTKLPPSSWERFFLNLEGDEFWGCRNFP